MLAHQDFVPKQLAAAAFLKAAEYESFEAAVKAADEWISQNHIDVINVETVVLPNIHAWGQGSSAAAYHQPDNFGASWFQFIRVWYRTG